RRPRPGRAGLAGLARPAVRLLAWLSDAPDCGAPPAMRVGLVLGGGGVRGAAWLIGALQGVAAEIGWLPAQAELVVGTSAGAVVAALAAGGPAPWATLTADRSEG